MKKVLARVTGKGFQDAGGMIEHKSKILYTSGESFKSKAQIEEIVHGLLTEFAIGIEAALENPRIKNGSIRIYFEVLE